MTLSMRPPRRPLLLILISLAFIACGEKPEDPTVADEARVGTTTKYAWYMEGAIPAGSTTIVRTGDGRVTNESFVHWNNRKWTVNSTIQLDRDGLIASQKITGISPFMAPIDEAFDYTDGVASWRTTGDNGAATTDEPAFYLPNVGIAFGALESLVRAATRKFDNEIPLFPSGTARVERVLQKKVAKPGGDSVLALFAIIGPDFTPRYLWFDDSMRLIAYDRGGFLGMIPEGWDPSLLPELSAAQSEQAGRYIAELGAELAHRVDASLVIENVDIVDVANGGLLNARHVRVADGVIADLSESPIEDGDALRIDATGKTLMPGIWDMHGHFSLTDGLLNIAGGVTNVRDIGSVHAKIMELTAKYDSGEVIGPNTYRAGFIDRAGPYASGWAAETLDDALARVDFFAEHDYIQIKLYSSVEPDWVAPIAARAHSHGLRLSGHVPAFMSAEQAVQAGYDEIQHINMVFLNFLAGDRVDTRKQLRFTLYGDEAGNLNLDSEEVRDFLALLRENDVVIDATAAIFDTQLRHLPGDPDPTFAAVIEHLPPAVARPLYTPDMVWKESWGRSAETQAAMLKALHDAGVQLVPGSDHMPAFTLHREIELYAEAGIPVADVLRIATLDSARVAGVADRKGSIEVGKDSDLVLLDGNPLEDISAVRRGVLVLKGNTLYKPDELYRAVGVKPFLPSTDF